MLSAKIFNSRIRSEKVTKKEKVLGYFLGPIGVTVLTNILGSYLNVYYTDVIDIAAIGGGVFLSLFPFLCKGIDAVTFVLMGRVVDRTRSPQGKARPWILLSAPVLLISMILLFAVPDGNQWMRAAWIFISYNLYYSIGFTAYSTSHTLLVPLATNDEQERSSLSLISNALYMVSGTFLAIVFPCVLVPMMGTNRHSWLVVISAITLVCCPLLLFEYFFTVERVTMGEKGRVAERKKSNFVVDLKLCLKSRQWIIFMIYIIILQLFNALSSNSIFYYCNWVLGSYNDGITQALYYGVGNAPMALGVFLCNPICRKFGRRKAMRYGFTLAAIGSLICCLSPRSMIVVLLGQAVKSVGLIPSSFMVTTMLADALDDVEEKSQIRCDGFTSSVYNIINTLAGGVALFLFNTCIVALRYQAPGTAGSIPVQNGAIQWFFIFCALMGPVICYGLLAGLLRYEE